MQYVFAYLFTRALSGLIGVTLKNLIYNALCAVAFCAPFLVCLLAFFDVLI